MKKLFFLISVLFLFLIGGFLIFSGVFNANQAKAGAGQNVSGWAWSKNIGWISFNNASGGGPNNYGVNIIDSGTTGILSGYAWSGNAGWLSFSESDLVGCPAGTCRAWVDKPTGQVFGWAKFLATGDWLRLRGNNCNVSISRTDNSFSGWAWGGETAGWVSFSCNQTETGDICPSANYKVQTVFSLNSPPTADTLAVSGSNFCTLPTYNFSWVFQDPDLSDSQSAYQLQVDQQGDFASFIEGEVDLTASSDSNNITVILARNPGLDQLGYNVIPYYWRVKVWDSSGLASAWSNGASFTTPAHVFPSPDFTWKPSNPAKNQVVQLCAVNLGGACPTDVSICYGAGYPSCASADFLWTLPPNAEFIGGTTAASKNPKVKFKDVGDQTVTLQITDDVGMCSISKQIKATLPLPKWKEVPPEE